MTQDKSISNQAWRPLQKMFTEVPQRYDLMNRLLTLRFDEKWRKIAADECSTIPSGMIVDLCTGTGDLGLHIAKRVDRSVQVSGVDYSRPMLEIAKKKSERLTGSDINFIEADAAALPFDDQSVDVIGIAFAFRNLTYKNRDRDKFLSEIFRILKKPGKFVIVETSQPGSKAVRWFFYLYLKIVVSRIGGWLSGHHSAYRYLSASARHFYSPSELKRLLTDAGFSSVSHRSFLGGISALTVAYNK